MKRAAGYVGLVIGWLLLAFAVASGGFSIGALLLDFADVILWRVALGVLVVVVLAFAGTLLIRWARSVLGASDRSRPGRVVLGLVLIAFGALINSSEANLNQVAKDGGRGASIAVALFGAALILETWWNRAPRSHTTPLTDAATTRPDSIAGSNIGLPEPPPDR